LRRRFRLTAVALVDIQEIVAARQRTAASRL